MIDRRDTLAALLAFAATPLHAAARAPTVRVALLGQSLIQQDLCRSPWPGLSSLRQRLRGTDLVFTDLETTISGPLAGAPTREAGTDVLHVAAPEVLDCLQSLGIELFATSNNHAWDLDTGGIASTLEALDSRGLAHAGSGANLAQASAAGMRTTRHGTVALVAAAAGAIRDGAAAMAARAGVNELRVVQGIADETDVARCLASIRAARESGASVIAYLHNHYWEKDTSATPEWQRRYARACIDAGAALFVAHGPPLLQGIETWRGAPLCHGLGSFIFQTRKPADSYGPETWQSACVLAQLQDGRCSDVRILPVQLDATPVVEGAGQISRGVPRLASGPDAQRILAKLLSLSERLGCRLKRGGDGLEL